MAALKQLLVALQIMKLCHLLEVSAEDSSSAIINMTRGELQTLLQDSLKSISKEVSSMKTNYEENQASLISRLNEVQSAVSESNSRVNELKQAFAEHRLSVENQMENIKRVMMEDHTILKTNSLNIFNKMVDMIVEIRLQHRLQKDILDEVEDISGHLESLETNKQCIEDEIQCPECSNDQRSNKTSIQFPGPTDTNNILTDVETLAPPTPAARAPDPPAAPHAPSGPRHDPPPHALPGPRRAPHPLAPPPQRETMTTPQPTTITQRTETNSADCVAPFFHLEPTGECMVVSVTKRTWMDAQNSCLRIGAYLAVPEEPRVLHAYMRQAGAHNYYYIGAHNKPGDFRWLNGTIVNPRYWRPHSPSTSYPSRLCVAYSHNGSGNKLLWANKATLCDNGLRYNFICEK